MVLQPITCCEHDTLWNGQDLPLLLQCLSDECAFIMPVNWGPPLLQIFFPLAPGIESIWEPFQEQVEERYDEVQHQIDEAMGGKRRSRVILELFIDCSQCSLLQRCGTVQVALHRPVLLCSFFALQELCVTMQTLERWLISLSKRSESFRNR